MAGPFQDAAFSTPIGVTSAPFKSTCLLNYYLHVSSPNPLHVYCARSSIYLVWMLLLLVIWKWLPKNMLMVFTCLCL
ncbi:hypothetical protein MUK42_03571 [Musa troglodytarum]|uniref:Uncharacterized protein n=1 Tax=Musa troglodytarum TaxID=320322 RepID=A0A9E7GS72_9LILI|nr:hypothetical protein MUK42_03571 [Musa troglodytarum]